MMTLQTEVKNKRLSFDEFIQAAKQNGQAQSKEELMRTLQNNIAQYEQKYRMSTAEFVPRYERGEFESSDDYLDFELLDWYEDYQTFKA